LVVDATSPRSRRSLLTGVAGALAALGMSSLGRAQPANAATGDAVLLGKENDADHQTLIRSENADALTVLSFVDSNENVSVEAFSYSGTGLVGRSWLHNGIIGRSHAQSGEHYGVYGESNSIKARGVFGRARANAPAAGGTGVWGQADRPNGVGVRGLAWNNENGIGGYGTGVIGTSGSQSWPGPLNNTGVYGAATNGRGGVFKGDKAQIRLVPSDDQTHPSSGVVGDLFLDANDRLWFCKGGTSWKQLA